MNIEHLKSMLFQKNKKGRYREITIIPKIKKFDYESGGSRSDTAPVYSRCHHCSAPVAKTSGISVVRATCSDCVTRDRMARIQA